jgi:hypothetical protein
LARGASGSGKSVLKGLLEKSYAAHGWRVIALNFLGADATDDAFEACWRNATTLTLTDLMEEKLKESKIKTVILADEVQKLFFPVSTAQTQKIERFFSILRSWKLCNSFPYGRALCFGSFLHTPGNTATAFGNDGNEPDGYRLLGLSDLRLPELEL